MQAAVLLAEDADAHLTLLNVVDVPPELRRQTSLDEVDVNTLRAADAASRLRHLRQLVPESARTYCHVETLVGDGRPSREILRVAAARASNLTVMGVRGRGVFSRLMLGSTTHDVLQEATCPVLIQHNG
jgi:nucleotide-binding universal stress UspA family protein